MKRHNAGADGWSAAVCRGLGDTAGGIPAGDLAGLTGVLDPVDLAEVEGDRLDVDDHLVGGGDGFGDVTEAQIRRGIRVVDNRSHGRPNSGRP